MDNLEQPASQDSDVADNAASETPSLAAQVDQDNELFGDGSALNDGENTDTEEEQDEIEVDGRKFPLPKSAAERLKAERLMHADYTRKTQELASQRTNLDAERETAQKQYQAQQQFIQDHARVVALNDQLAAYEKLDWNALIQHDPQQAMVYQQQQRELERQRDEASSSIAQKQQQFALDEQQSFAKQVQEAKAYVEREIPGWTNQRDSQLQQYAEGIGLNAKELGPMMIKHPVMFSLLHKAEMYDRLAKAAPKQPQQQAVSAKPAPKVGSNASVSKDPTKMTDAEFAKYRNQVRNRK